MTRLPFDRQWPGAAILAAVAVTGCAVRTPEPVQRECVLQVINATSQIVEVRIPVRAYSTWPIGTLNPGELLNYNLPCAAGRVFVMGREVPWAVGAPRTFGAVYGEADLIEGERARIILTWP